MMVFINDLECKVYQNTSMYEYRVSFSPLVVRGVTKDDMHLMVVCIKDRYHSKTKSPKHQVLSQRFLLITVTFPELSWDGTSRLSNTC